MDLIIDQEFQNLIPPLTKSEYDHLEISIKSEGCRDPLILWHGIIVDGHNRYEICTRLKIPYTTEEHVFSSRAEVISWICLNQLSRRNITLEAYQYLVGKRYDAEKTINQQKNASGRNQFSKAYDPEHTEKEPDAGNPGILRTSDKIGNELHLSHTTVERYGQYSRSLDAIERKAPGILTSILTGELKLSQDNIVEMAAMPAEKVQDISDRLHRRLEHRGYVPKNAANQELYAAINASEKEKNKEEIITLCVGVKQMPEYDPDAEAKGLILTMPTWKNAIERFLESEALKQVSAGAKNELIFALRELESSLSKLQHKLR